MGDVLIELEHVLRAKQITIEEANMLQTCKSKAVRDFTFGGLIGGAVTWAGTWRLNKLIRLTHSAGIGVMCGTWVLGRRLHSCADHILAMDGSRMQKEMTNIILVRYLNNPRVSALISKHFYCEEVFDDSTLDRPKIRLRHRNFFSDDVAHVQRMHDNDPKDNLHGNSNHALSNRDSSADQSAFYGEPDDKGNALEFKPVLTKPGNDAATSDPLDCIFGLAKEEEIQHTSTSRPSSKSHSRSRRYNRRHHRRDDQTMPTNFEHV